MCTLHLFFQMFPGTPVLFAVNRDEILDRPWDPPGLLGEEPRIFGPRDAVAGGTWLGVNEGGVLVGLANHEGTLSKPQAASLCSRGAVVLETLRNADARAAATFAKATAPACKAYTLLVADPQDAFVVERSPRGTAVHRLEAGCHAVTNAPFRHPADPKAARVRERMNALAASGRLPTVGDLSLLLADHEPATPQVSPVCIHPVGASRFGTSSASAVFLGADRRVQSFLFAAGAPCATPFRALPADEALRDPGRTA